MGILDEYADLINASFSRWIEVEDDQSRWTIEDFPYSTGVDEAVTYPHCWRCVTVNHCWFKNEANKKPSRFDYSNTSFSQTPLSKRGLYHPHCHCKESTINVPKVNNIKLILDNAKKNYFFDSKLGWFHSWGYKNSDKNNFIEMIKNKIAEAFRYGNYTKEKLTRTGYQINISITIPGKNEKINKEYEIVSAFIIFPKGTLRCVTLVGGREN